ncbi:hypothetical protein Tco_0809254 [Tanacetum coccineum]
MLPSWEADNGSFPSAYTIRCPLISGAAQVSVRSDFTWRVGGIPAKSGEYSESLKYWCFLQVASPSISLLVAVSVRGPLHLTLKAVDNRDLSLWDLWYCCLVVVSSRSITVHEQIDSSFCMLGALEVKQCKARANCFYEWIVVVFGFLGVILHASLFFLLAFSAVEPRIPFPLADSSGTFITHGVANLAIVDCKASNQYLSLRTLLEEYKMNLTRLDIRKLLIRKTIHFLPLGRQRDPSEHLEIYRWHLQEVVKCPFTLSRLSFLAILKPWAVMPSLLMLACVKQKQRNALDPQVRALGLCASKSYHNSSVLVLTVDLKLLSTVGEGYAVLRHQCESPDSYRERDVVVRQSLQSLAYHRENISPGGCSWVCRASSEWCGRGNGEDTKVVVVGCRAVSNACLLDANLFGQSRTHSRALRGDVSVAKGPNEVLSVCGGTYQFKCSVTQRGLFLLHLVEGNQMLSSESSRISLDRYRLGYNGIQCGDWWMSQDSGIVRGCWVSDLPGADISVHGGLGDRNDEGRIMQGSVENG